MVGLELLDPSLSLRALVEYPQCFYPCHARRRRTRRPLRRRLFGSGWLDSRSFTQGVLQRRDMPEAMLEAMRRLARRRRVSGWWYQAEMTCTGQAELSPGRSRRMPGLKEFVTFTGYLSDEAFRRQRAAADGYVLLHEDSWESRACFPTRLSEFLCAGRPLIVSGVGDIPLYVRDGKDAVVLPPNNQAKH